jgi:predicted Zn finger-like uncharacterized protein
MKIECQSCGAAYKIADEKVQGKKVFKIKCKKCSSDIIVRGTDYAEPQRPAEDEATRAMDTSAGGEEPIWHVVLNGEQQGPYSIPQVREMLAGGHIDAETYVWRDGFDGWLPMQEVGELAAVFSAPSAEHEAPFMGNDLFASIAPPPAAEAPAAVAAAAPASDLYSTPEPSRSSARPATAEPAKARAKVAGGDLFATEARAQEASKPLFSGTDEAPAAQGHGDSMTGQRNENSVLFSLDSLQAMATAGSTAARPNVAAPAARASSNPSKGLATAAPSSEGSGLIDIRSLGSMVGGGGAMAAASAAPQAAADDAALPSFGGGGFGGLAATPLVSPTPAVVEAPPPVVVQRSNAPLYIMMIVLILAVGGLGAFILLKKPDEPKTIVQEVPVAAPSVKDDDEDEKKKKDDEDEKKKDDEKKDDEKAADEGAEGEAADDAAGVEGETKDGVKSGGTKKSSGGSSTKKTGGGTTTSGGTSGGTQTSGGGTKSGGSDAPSVDCILDPSKCGTPKKTGGGSSGGTSGGSTDPSAPEKLSATDIKNGMAAVKDSAKACGPKHGGKPGEKVTVKLSFSGATGTVTKATPQPPHDGTPLGNCVAAALKNAKVIKFKAASQGASYGVTM